MNLQIRGRQRGESFDTQPFNTVTQTQMQTPIAINRDRETLNDSPLSHPINKIIARN